MNVSVQIPIATPRFAHALAILPRSRVNADVDHRNGDERRQNHEDEVDEGVDGVENAMAGVRSRRFVAEVPEAGVILRNGPQDPEDYRH